jgi:hypothetical protein
VKNKIKVQVDGIEGGQVSEPVERLAISSFNSLDELDNFVDRCLVKHASGFPEDERQILPEQNVSGKFQLMACFEQKLTEATEKIHLPLPSVHAELSNSLHQLKIPRLPALVEPGLNASERGEDEFYFRGRAPRLVKIAPLHILKKRALRL